jgi:hypothetical protein
MVLFPMMIWMGAAGITLLEIEGATFVVSYWKNCRKESSDWWRVAERRPESTTKASIPTGAIADGDSREHARKV